MLAKSIKSTLCAGMCSFGRRLDAWLLNAFAIGAMSSPPHTFDHFDEPTYRRRNLQIAGVDERGPK